MNYWPSFTVSSKQVDDDTGKQFATDSWGGLGVLDLATDSRRQFFSAIAGPSTQQTAQCVDTAYLRTDKQRRRDIEQFVSYFPLSLKDSAIFLAGMAHRHCTRRSGTLTDCEQRCFGRWSSVAIKQARKVSCEQLRNSHSRVADAILCHWFFLVMFHNFTTLLLCHGKSFSLSLFSFCSHKTFVFISFYYCFWFLFQKFSYYSRLGKDCKITWRMYRQMLISMQTGYV